MSSQMNSARRFFETHHGSNSPLVVIHQFVRAHGLPDPAQVKKLSQEVALPEAIVRGALSFYSDLHQDSKAARVCVGTSRVLRCAPSATRTPISRTNPWKEVPKIYLMRHANELRVAGAVGPGRDLRFPFSLHMI